MAKNSLSHALWWWSVITVECARLISQVNMASHCDSCDTHAGYWQMTQRSQQKLRENSSHTLAKVTKVHPLDAQCKFHA